MGATVGRNDPCPCGSGKKFKRCCDRDSPALSVVEGPSPGWDRLQALWSVTVQLLGEHFEEWLGEGAEADAWQEFHLAEDERSPVDESLRMLFDSWRFYDWIQAGMGRTVAAHWLSTRAAMPGADPAVAKLIEAACHESISAFQIERSRAGRGIFVRDVFTGEKRFVADRSLSQGIQPGAIVLGRLVTSGEVTIFDAVAPRPLPPDFEEHLIDHFVELASEDVPLAPRELRSMGDHVVGAYAEALTDLSELRGGPTPSSPSSDPEAIVPPEAARAVTASFLSNYYARWPDDPLPALGGETPRQAMKTTTGARRVDAIIGEMEHQSHGTPLGGAYDFDDLRKALGMVVVRVEPQST